MIVTCQLLVFPGDAGDARVAARRPRWRHPCARTGGLDARCTQDAFPGAHLPRYLREDRAEGLLLDEHDGVRAGEGPPKASSLSPVRSPSSTRASCGITIRPRSPTLAEPYSFGRAVGCRGVGAFNLMPPSIH